MEKLPHDPVFYIESVKFRKRPIANKYHVLFRIIILNGLFRRPRSKRRKIHQVFLFELLPIAH